MEGIDYSFMHAVFEGGMDLAEYRKNVILVFYKVGLVGLKTDPHLQISWSFKGGVGVSQAEIREDTRVYVQETFWRVLGVSGQNRRSPHLSTRQ